MASTTEYLRQTSFADAQAANPNAPPSGPGLDGEFDRVKLALDSTQQSLDLIQRDDGALKNGVVTFDSLSPGLLTGLEPATVWATSTNYIVNNTVFIDDGLSIKLYRCVVSHTSAVAFATDLAAGRWTELVDYTPPTVVGVIAVANGGTGATTPTTARTNLGLGDVATENVLPVAKGGTGATSATAARTALGLGGASVEDVVPLAKGGTGATDAAGARTALGATATGVSLLTAANAAAARSAIGAGLPGIELIVKKTASNSASLDFTEFNAAVYDSYLFVIQNIRPATDNDLLALRTSANGGSTYDGAGSYSWGYTFNAHAAGSPSSTGNASAAIMTLSNTPIGNAAGEDVSGEVRVYDPAAARRTRATWNLQSVDGSTASWNVVGSGSRLSEATVNAVQFLCGVGNIASGSIVMYGMRR